MEKKVINARNKKHIGKTFVVDGNNQTVFNKKLHNVGTTRDNGWTPISLVSKRSVNPIWLVLE
tara:strand:+ start:122 stop:310 length:189 start_codon:yes stop_codon:yes gene_type:complete